MSFWSIAWRNMRQRGLASSLTALNMALGVAVMVCVIVIHSVTVRQFSQDAQGYHLIVGSGKGSPLELVLSTVFHISKPLYPIPYSSYRDFTDGRYAEVTEVAVPYCLGDSFEAGGDVYRVIATTPDLFDKLAYGTNEDGSDRNYTFHGGRNFKIENCYEAVIGSVVASNAGLDVGDTFNPSHGIGGGDNKHNAFKIVGVLDSTGTANDRALFVNIEGFFLIDDHALPAKTSPGPGGMAIIGVNVAEKLKLKAGDRLGPGDREVVSVFARDGTPIDNAVFLDDPGLAVAVDEQAAGDAQAATTGAAAAAPRGVLPPAVCFDNEGGERVPLPEAQREVTSVLVLCTDSFSSRLILGGINKNQRGVTQAVAPGGVVATLLNKIIAPIQVVLLVLTVLVIAVAAIGILVSIYNSMSERAHDIAVMRALGARRTAVMAIVLFESILLAVLGGAVGLFVGHGLVGLAAPYVESQTGVQIAALAFDPLELAIIPSLVLLASVVGFLPALSAYRTDVARAL